MKLLSLFALIAFVDAFSVMPTRVAKPQPVTQMGLAKKAAPAPAAVFSASELMSSEALERERVRRERENKKLLFMASTYEKQANLIKYGSEDGVPQQEKKKEPFVRGFGKFLLAPLKAIFSS